MYDCRMYSILLLLLSIFLAEACPPNSDVIWTELGDYCYHVSHDAMDWGIAQEYCWGHGGYLAEIMSRDEENLLDKFLVSGISYWLGLTDLSHEGTIGFEKT